MEQTATAVAPLNMYNDAPVSLANRSDVNKEKTRYLFSLGDHIADQDKSSFESIGGYFGGLWVGHSETEGCPTMKRTNYMLYRGAITPLETTAIPKKADHRSTDKNNENFLTGQDVPPNIRGYYVYAGDTLNFLQSDKYRPMGVVELQALKYKSWKESNARQLQLLLFPEWNNWLQGAKAPVLLDDWISEVNKAFNRHPELQVFMNDIYDSGNLFKDYGLGHIERNRQQILAKRAVDNGGMFVGWSGTSRLYAKQLNVTLEAEAELRPTGQVQSTGDSALIREMQEERKLRAEESRQNRELIGMLAKMLQDKNGGEPLPFVQDTLEPLPQVPEVKAEGESTEDLSKFVSTGNVVEDDPKVKSRGNKKKITDNSGPVGLTDNVKKPVDPENNPVRKEFDAAMNDPAFEAAVESDAGLRGAIKDNPNLKGAIEEED